MAVVGIAFLLAVLPTVLPDARSHWPHEELPEGPIAAVEKLESRLAWEDGWRFRLCQDINWKRFIKPKSRLKHFPQLDPVAMQRELTEEAIARVAVRSEENQRDRALLVRLITEPTLPVRIRKAAIGACEVFHELPAEVVVALTSVLEEPAIAAGADLRNWWNQPRPDLAPLAAAEHALRVSVLDAITATRTRSPRVMRLLRSLLDHPRIAFAVQIALHELQGGVPPLRSR
jgi:hypothetical protein